VLLDGVDLYELDLRACRRQIGVVPSAIVVFTGSVQENVAFGLDDASEDVPPLLERRSPIGRGGRPASSRQGPGPEVGASSFGVSGVVCQKSTICVQTSGGCSMTVP
jgi:hypothetical protein